jgi:hypothetical protein
LEDEVDDFYVPRLQRAVAGSLSNKLYGFVALKLNKPSSTSKANRSNGQLGS